MPRWMAAQIKAGKKREDFAIGERVAKLKKSSRKKTRGNRKRCGRDREAHFPDIGSEDVR